MISALHLHSREHRWSVVLGCRFESHSRCHIGTLSKSFTPQLPVALRHVNSDTINAVVGSVYE